ncbi:hypothetical protein SALBM135S_04940 [Streptomyces alboniger]
MIAPVCVLRGGSSSGAAGEELRQGGGQRPGLLLGDMVAGVDAMAAHVVGPSAPDLQRIAVQVLEIVPE